MNMSNEARDCLREMVNEVAKMAPTKGKTVHIARGKHKGKEGEVFWHGQDKYYDPFRYNGNSAQKTMTEAKGRIGYRIGVKTSEGEKFFTKAEYAVVEGAFGKVWLRDEKGKATPIREATKEEAIRGNYGGYIEVEEGKATIF